MHPLTKLIHDDMIPALGVTGIWWSVPIGWALADATGFLYYFLRQNQLLARL